MYSSFIGYRLTHGRTNNLIPNFNTTSLTTTLRTQTRKIRLFGCVVRPYPVLLRFWKQAGYVPLRIRQTPNDLTGEHACVTVGGLLSSVDDELGCLTEFTKDFRKRFLSLLLSNFREFGSASVLEAANAGVKQDQIHELGSEELNHLLTPFDLKRLESYANNMLDYHVILDLLPTLALLYFQKRLGEEVRLSVMRSAISLALGLQRKSIEQVEAELQLPVSQALALFVKTIRKLSKKLIDIKQAAINAQLSPIPSTSTSTCTSRLDVGDEDEGITTCDFIKKTLENELNEAGDKDMCRLKEKQLAMPEPPEPDHKRTFELNEVVLSPEDESLPLLIKMLIKRWI